MHFLYRFLIYPALVAASRIVSLRRPKMRATLEGRNAWRSQVASFPSAAPGARRVHVHAASVGEFEQAKPVIAALRREGPAFVTASFFSSSGYRSAQAWSGIDGACYLPHDRAGEMRAFFERVAPDLVIVVRYDLWPEFMRAAEEQRVPVVLICGVLREDSVRFRPLLRGLFENVYRRLELIDAVSDEDRRAFQRLVPDVPVRISGDTRYDQVAARAKGRENAPANRAIGAIAGVAEGRRILVAGSTWPEDERLIAELQGQRDLLLVLVPHEPTEEHLRTLGNRFDRSVRLSALTNTDTDSASVGSTSIGAVIVDAMGILAELYGVGDIAYVGGGFGAGVHSVLEPAVHGLPVYSGPKIERSRDAVEMASEKVLTVVREPSELTRSVASLLDDDALRGERGKASERFVASRMGATERIMGSLREAGLIGASS